MLRLKAEESIYDVFTWPEGDFRFLDEQLPNANMVPISIDVTGLVLEGMQRFDEWKRIRETDPVVALGAGRGRRVRRQGPDRRRAADPRPDRRRPHGRRHLQAHPLERVPRLPDPLPPGRMRAGSRSSGPRGAPVADPAATPPPPRRRGDHLGRAPASSPSRRCRRASSRRRCATCAPRAPSTPTAASSPAEAEKIEEQVRAADREIGHPADLRAGPRPHRWKSSPSSRSRRRRASS